MACIFWQDYNEKTIKNWYIERQNQCPSIMSEWKRQIDGDSLIYRAFLAINPATKPVSQQREFPCQNNNPSFRKP